VFPCANHDETTSRVLELREPMATPDVEAASKAYAEIERLTKKLKDAEDGAARALVSVGPLPILSDERLKRLYCA